MRNRLIIFLIRRRLGLKKYEHFRFDNQKSKDVYYFTATELMKIWAFGDEKSGVSLNWLLDPECKIVKLKDIKPEGG
jgi:hypothetical protein